MEELTYEEHLERKRKVILDQYRDQIDNSLRNIELKVEDIEDGLLTDTFFNREDISDIKKEILQLLTNKAKEELTKYTI